MKLCTLRVLRGDKSLDFQTVPIPNLCAASSFVNPALSRAHIKRSGLTIASIRLPISHYFLFTILFNLSRAPSQANNQLSLALILKKQLRNNMQLYHLECGVSLDSSKPDYSTVMNVSFSSSTKSSNLSGDSSIYLSSSSKQTAFVPVVIIIASLPFASLNQPFL